MNTKSFINRHRAACLFFISAVLLLGIVQWSFLPLLIQSWPAASAPVLAMSAGHTSKFAAPFKCLFGDDLRPCLVQLRILVQGISFGMIHLPEAPVLGWTEISLAQRPLRAPPSA